MNILKTSFKSFFFNILGSGLAFIFQIMSAKYFGADAFGKANYFMGYSSTITLFICFGLQTYLPKKISETRNKEEMFSEVVTTYTLCFFVLQLILYIIFKLNNISSFNYLIITVLAYLISLSEIILSYNVSTGNAAKGMFYRKFIYSLMNVILICLVYVLSIKKYYAYLIIMILSYSITCIPFVINNICSFKLNFKILKYSLGFYSVQIIYGLYTAYSRVLQKQFGTFETVAVLSISMTIGSLVAMLGDNFAKVSMPEFSKAWHERDFSKLKSIYMNISRINCFLVLPIAIGLIVNSNRILNLLGKGYTGGEIIFSLIMVSQFINSFTGPSGTLLLMTKYTQFEIYNGIVKLMASILVVFLLGYKVVWAIALSLALSEVIVNTLKFIQVKVKLNIVPYKITDLIYIILLASGEIPVLMYTSKIKNIILWILINGLAVILFYLITFILSPNKEDKVMIKNIIAKLKPAD